MERPLVVMECSVLDEKYMGIQDQDKALEFMLEMKNKCRMFEGQFVFLWHNSRLVEDWQREMYGEMLGYGVRIKGYGIWDKRYGIRGKKKEVRDMG